MIWKDHEKRKEVSSKTHRFLTILNSMCPKDNKCKYYPDSWMQKSVMIFYLKCEKWVIRQYMVIEFITLVEISKWENVMKIWEAQDNDQHLRVGFTVCECLRREILFSIHFRPRLKLCNKMQINERKVYTFKFYVTQKPSLGNKDPKK